FWAAAVPDADGLLAAWEQPGITAEDHDALRSSGPGLTSAEEADAAWSPRDVWTAAPAPAGPDPDGTGLPSGWEPDADTMDVDDPHPLDDEAQVLFAPPSGPVPSGSAPNLQIRPAGKNLERFEEFMHAAREYDLQNGSLKGITAQDLVNVGGKAVHLGRWLQRLEIKSINLPGEELMLELLGMGWSPSGDDVFNEYIAELEKLRGTRERGVQDDGKEGRRILVRLVALRRNRAASLQGAANMSVEEIVALEAEANEVLARIAKMKGQGIRITRLAKAVAMDRNMLESFLSGKRQLSIDLMGSLVDPRVGGRLRELETPQVAANGERRPPLTINQKNLADKNWARVQSLYDAGVPPIKLLPGLKMQISTLRDYIRTRKELSSYAAGVFSDPGVSVWLDELEAEMGGAVVGGAVPEGSGSLPSQGGEEESADTSR
ncbi:hypothetical protein, partial [Streptomyces sp. NPDC086010]|uniref:hypothetical protein n=1 Tax=Streptomyces sp. NPDC086010 TaxID=3365745 RepID=UPI0037D7B5F5